MGAYRKQGARGSCAGRVGEGRGSVDGASVEIARGTPVYPVSSLSSRSAAASAVSPASTSPAGSSSVRRPTGGLNSAGAGEERVCQPLGVSNPSLSVVGGGGAYARQGGSRPWTSRPSGEARGWQRRPRSPRASWSAMPCPTCAPSRLRRCSRASGASATASSQRRARRRRKAARQRPRRQVRRTTPRPQRR